MDATTFSPVPVNEPNLTYAPGTSEREILVAELARLERRTTSMRAVIGGKLSRCSQNEAIELSPQEHWIGRHLGRQGRDGAVSCRRLKRAGRHQM